MVPSESLPDTDKLPVAFRGYAREETDALLRQVEESYRALVSERDDLRARLETAERERGELERELAEHRKQSRAVGDALIAAERLKAESEQEAAAIRARGEEEAAALKAEAERERSGAREGAEREAESILREAEAKAQRLVEEVQRNLEERQHEAEHFLDDTKERLSSLVRDLLGKLGSSQGEAAPSHPDTPEPARDSAIEQSNPASD